MLEGVVRFSSLFCLGVVSGVAFCVLLAERVWTGDARFYTQLMQLWSRALTRPTTVLGAGALAAIGTDAALLFSRHDRTAAPWLAASAAALDLVALALTKFGHFPINDRVAKWNAESPPEDWKSVQAHWSALHVGRTAFALSSFALLVLSNALRG